MIIKLSPIHGALFRHALLTKISLSACPEWDPLRPLRRNNCLNFFCCFFRPHHLITQTTALDISTQSTMASGLGESDQK